MTKTSTLTIMRNGSEKKESPDQEEEDAVPITIHLPDKGTKQIFTLNIHEKLWISKQLVILQIAKDVKDPINYGFYEPPYNGRSGKFLDEERPLKEYPFRENGLYLEFKYKKRVYRSISYDEKKLTKLHTKANYRRLLDAISANSVRQVTRMVDKGLDPNFQDEKTGETPLTLAVSKEKGDDLILALVNGGAHIDFRMANGLTPIHKAAMAGNPHSIKTLLDLGASPNYRDLKGLSPLYYTTLNGGDPYCCELLLNEHAELGVTDNQGWQEIHHAAMNGLAQHVEHLLFYGADINKVTTTGKNTALHLAALHNQDRCVRVLLCRGADRTIINGANQSPYETAVVAGNTSLGEAIRKHTEDAVVPYASKPSFSTRRRKPTSKPTLTSLFKRSPSEPSSIGSSRSDSGFPPSPVSSTNSAQSFQSHNSGSGSCEETNKAEDMTDATSHSSRRRTLSTSSSDSSYCSDTEDSSQLSPSSPTRTRKQWASSAPDLQAKYIPPVKAVSGAATLKKRSHTDISSRTYIAIKNNVSHQGGELQLLTGDIVEVFTYGEQGFWEGRTHGQTGWFPRECVEELKNVSKAGKQSSRTKGVLRPQSLANLFGKNDQPPSAGVLSYVEKSESQPDLGYMRESPLQTCVRVVRLTKGKGGYGFQLRGANSRVSYLEFTPTPEFPTLQYIAEVQKEGEAERKGVKVGDFIHEVNGENVVSATHGYVVELIKNNGSDVLRLKLETVPFNKDGTIRLKLKKHQQEKEMGRFSTLTLGRPPKAPKPAPPTRDPSTTLTLGRMKASPRPSVLDAKSFEQPTAFPFDRTLSTGDLVIAPPYNIRLDNTMSRTAPYNAHTLNRYTRAVSQPDAHDSIWIPRTNSDNNLQENKGRPKSVFLDQRSMSIQSTSSDPIPWSNGDYSTLSRNHGTPNNNNDEKSSFKPRPFSYIEPGTLKSWDVNKRDGENTPTRSNRSYSLTNDAVKTKDEDIIVIATPIRVDDNIRVSVRPKLETDVDSIVNYESDDEAESPRTHRRSLYETDVDSIIMNYTVPEPEGISWQPRVTDLDEVIRQRERQRRDAEVSSENEAESRSKRLSQPLKSSTPVRDSRTESLEKDRTIRNERSSSLSADSRAVFKNILSQKIILHEPNSEKTVQKDERLIVQEQAQYKELPKPEQLRKPLFTGSQEELLNKKLESIKRNNEHSKQNGTLKNTEDKRNEKTKKSVKEKKSVPNGVPPPPPLPPVDYQRERKSSMTEMLADAVAQRNARVSNLNQNETKTNSTPPLPKVGVPPPQGLSACLQQISLKGQSTLKKPDTKSSSTQETKAVDHNSMLAQAIAARAKRVAAQENNAVLNLEKKKETADEERGTNLVKPSEFLKQNAQNRQSESKLNEILKQTALQNNQSERQRIELLKANTQLLDSKPSVLMKPSFQQISQPDTLPSESLKQNLQLNGDASNELLKQNARNNNSETIRAEGARTPTMFNSSVTLNLRSPNNFKDQGDRTPPRKKDGGSDSDENSTVKKNVSPFQFPNKVFSEEELATMMLDDVIEQEAERNNWNMSGWSDIMSDPPFTKTVKCSPTSSGRSSLSASSTWSSRSNNSVTFVPVGSTPESTLPPPPQFDFIDGPTEEMESPGLPLPPPPVDFEDSFNESGNSFIIPPPPMQFFGGDDEVVLPPPVIPSLPSLVNGTDNVDEKPPPIPPPPKKEEPPKVITRPEVKPKPSRVPSPPGFKKISFREWTSVEVCQWLDFIKMADYKESFEENDIQGIHLTDLTKADLAELGVKRLGHRMSIVDAISKLCSNEEMTC